MEALASKLRLHGFNNLTKTLSFNMYDICFTKTEEDRKAYIEYINEQYNADRLTQILITVTEIIGANILNIAKQDYEPQGSSVTMLISEGPINIQNNSLEVQSASPGPLPKTIVSHLDKSHITVHTYPEYHPYEDISTFRVDIDVSTCGEISPLKALNYLIHCFDSDIMTLDYKVRGFTRDITGKKLFIDHKINSIQNYIPNNIKDLYNMIDVNIYQDNIFHTKCKLKAFDLDNYLFGWEKDELHPSIRKEITKKVKREMDEIFYGTNVATAMFELEED
ncbi:S-adenosylmethionine decarboxylase [Candidatus Epulonipiscium fishelsonii]|uniref:S-adenosylmethionine decarboxylase n=1 Tax=Candidatus Epulonipiscium fishelsonii TaxID=77094 RepID=A0ACC8XB70_9FIRM|nr:S-adenosylmethionine decarboxylase [Epulopiscium sp. SCG-B05WGA-EpuloA1]ONI39572.1 S-adenosylmethionine decarboxylase [Epulopiscium sp. SCG-B11WGA-EpuloA1]